ncbi:hypothetical protein [Candidatus Poriferisodalis sp.]|uniref:hypothetical protein n=1 Tax=Candidatus Poriferisodalis sp. TaxID=3101277 RepID=UPI003B5AE547
MRDSDTSHTYRGFGRASGDGTTDPNFHPTQHHHDCCAAEYDGDHRCTCRNHDRHCSDRNHDDDEASIRLLGRIDRQALGPVSEPTRLDTAEGNRPLRRSDLEGDDDQRRRGRNDLLELLRRRAERVRR